MLISREDVDRIDRLAAEREGDKDVVWLCQMARKLAAIKPTEAIFSRELTVVNVQGCNAIPVRLVETCFIEHVSELRGGKGLFEYTFESDVCDIHLFVRPYVRVIIPQETAILERLEKGKFTMKALALELDSPPVPMGTAPLAEILVGLDGYGARRKLFTVEAPISSEIFRAGSLDGGGESSTPGDYGAFMPNKTKLKIELETPPAVDGATVAVGLVCAKYTTKGILMPVLGMGSGGRKF